MPRFFFHLYDEGEAPDREGCEFPDAHAAIAEAYREARHVAGHVMISEGTLCLSHRIELVDESGVVLAKISFGDVVTVKR